MPTATATADRFHCLLLHINTGNSASLKNKISGELTFSKHIELLTELGILHRVINTKRVSDGNNNPSFEET